VFRKLVLTQLGPNMAQASTAPADNTFIMRL